MSTSEGQAHQDRRGRPVVISDAGAMHKYAAPRLEAERARDALSRALEMQGDAARLDTDHQRQHRRRIRRRQLRRVVLVTLLLAVLAIGLLMAPLDSWWDSLRAAAAGETAS